VKIGAKIQRLFDRLQACNARAPSYPLFLSTMGNHGFHRVYVGQAVTKPNTFDRLLPRVFAIFHSSYVYLVFTLAVEEAPHMPSGRGLVWSF